VPRYYFQLRDQTYELLDPEGIECSDDDALAGAVLANARDVIAGDAKRGVVNLRFRIDAEDETGTVVHSLSFTNAVRVLRAG